MRVEPENRCSLYNRKDHPYPQSVELEIIERDGLVSRYTGKEFASRYESDIEHIVALSEAPDSGLGGADSKTRRACAADLINLVPASPQLKRWGKKAKDPADWLPPQNRC